MEVLAVLVLTDMVLRIMDTAFCSRVWRWRLLYSAVYFIPYRDFPVSRTTKEVVLVLALLLSGYV